MKPETGNVPFVTAAPLRKPDWLKKNLRGDTGKRLSDVIGDLKLHTVCREARCPNATECFSEGQATFLILGRDCTRQCRFCNVNCAVPSPVDITEPGRVAEAVRRMQLKFVVITSPTRDDLPDGGASHFAETVTAVRRINPETRVEVLVPDFGGKPADIDTVLDAGPQVFSHNVETVKRLYHVRAGADYNRSLQVLAHAARRSGIPVKTGIMLGLGETDAEVRELFGDLVRSGCRFISIGQYLRPSLEHYPVAEYIRPERFIIRKKEALEAGFEKAESGPFVRSSYHASKFLTVAGEG